MAANVKVADLTSAANSGTVSSLVINKPANVVAGDVLVAMLHNQTAAVTGNETAKAWACTGWTLPVPWPKFYTDGRNRVSNFLYLVVTSGNVGSLPASWTFTGTTSGRVVGQIVAISGLDTADLLGGQDWNINVTDIGAGYGPASGGNGSTNYYPTQGPPYHINFTSGVPMLGLCFHFGQFTSGNINGVTTDMPSWTRIAETDSGTVTTTSRSNMVSYYRRYNGTSPLTPETQTMVWAAIAVSSASNMELFLKEKATTGGAGIPVRRVEAGPTLAAHRARVMKSDGPATPAHVRQLKPGAANVTALLAQAPFYVAHRGSSADWAEMSQYAYMRSSMYGVGALEISVARSSDGVYFGLHDSSLDRTSLGTGGGSGTTLMAASMTWAQIQAYDIIPPVGTVHQPYMRWEQLMDQFSKTHVIFVDPKVIGGAYWDTLLNMMDAAGGPTRFIAKYYGVEGGAGNTGWAKRSSDRGYQGWGYFYEADLPNLAAYQGRWSILGMEYVATQSAWDQIKTYGKPVIGHICPSLASATTALTKGANGIMGSGIAEIRVGSDVIK